MSAIDAAARPRTVIGVVMALAAAACFSLANTAASIAESGGSSPLTISAIRFLVPAAVLVVWLGVGFGGVLFFMKFIRSAWST